MSDHAKDERAPNDNKLSENQSAEAQPAGDPAERTEGTVEGDYEALSGCSRKTRN